MYSESNYYNLNEYQTRVELIFGKIPISFSSSSIYKGILLFNKF